MWQLVEAAFTQETTDGGEVGMGVLQQVGGYRRGIYAHGTEFGHTEEAVVFAYPFRPVQHCTGRGQAYPQGYDMTKLGRSRSRLIPNASVISNWRLMCLGITGLGNCAVGASVSLLSGGFPR